VRREQYEMLSSLRRFNHLRCHTHLAPEMPLPIAGIIGIKRRSSNSGFLVQEFHMFDGKNNRLLDSFLFRLAVSAAVFAVWSGAGYVLLYLA
jgi:hypothetical protein